MNYRELAEHLAEVIAEAAENHGTHDHHGQAVDVVAWLDGRGVLYPNADPWFTRHADGRVDLHWPGGVDRALISREVAEQMAADASERSQLYAMAVDESVPDAVVRTAILSRVLARRALTEADIRRGQEVAAILKAEGTTL